MNKFSGEYFNRWIKISLINLSVVAFIGVILRCKINFPLPFINQQYLLNGHSHFAFAGWASQILMLFIIRYLFERNPLITYRPYNFVLWANLITAWGMMLSFPFEGYAGISITFSTLSILVSCFFIVFAWKDLNKIQNKKLAVTWFKASMFFYALSSLGTFALAYLMANKINEQDYYFAAVYFFLHFQYNGWFLFACFGLFFYQLEKSGFVLAAFYSRRVFAILFAACFPAYLLSDLWMDIPQPLYLTAVCGAVIQLPAVLYVIQLFRRSKKNILPGLSKKTGWFWMMALIAFCIKIILQALSAIPALSRYAFGFRPVVIGYLHLSFLGITSFFIIGYINQYLSEQNKRLSSKGLILFASGVIITEILLMLQGFAGITYANIPFINESLFVTALVMFTGLLVLNVSLKMRNGKG